jgi:SAM-dependent methyltransferase
MPYDFHTDPQKYLELLVNNTRKSSLPFIMKHQPGGKSVIADLKILELGCGEGGNLQPFAEQGAHCIGMDLECSKIENGKEIMKIWVDNGTLELHCGNIFDENWSQKFLGSFDLIILKDVIEHIPHKAEALKNMRNYLTPKGLIFIGWPPYYMPFGGHQQIASNKWLKKLPWIHLLPRGVYAQALKAFGESKNMQEELLEIHDLRVTINQMNSMMQEAKLTLVASKFYFINPIYEDKFGLKTRILWKPFTKVPFIRDFLTTSCYYLLGK